MTKFSHDEQGRTRDANCNNSGGYFVGGRDNPLMNEGAFHNGSNFPDNSYSRGPPYVNEGSFHNIPNFPNNSYYHGPPYMNEGQFHNIPNFPDNSYYRGPLYMYGGPFSSRGQNPNMNEGAFSNRQNFSDNSYSHYLPPPPPPPLRDIGGLDSTYGRWPGQQHFFFSKDFILNYSDRSTPDTRMIFSRPEIDSVKKSLLTILTCESKLISQNKVPKYMAFSGSSGSGKTTTMINLVRQVHCEIFTFNPKISVLKVYICGVDENKELCVYLTEKIKQTALYKGIDFRNRKLLLVLDEVPSKFEHNDFQRIPDVLEQELGCERVGFLVGSTDLSRDVCLRPTSDSDLVNVRMLPIPDEGDHMKDLLKHHLVLLGVNEERAERATRMILDEIPFIYDLLGNHRCAELTAKVLKKLYGPRFQSMELTPGWCQGNSEIILAMVAYDYRSLNGLKKYTPKGVEDIMLKSLALVAVQPIVEHFEDKYGPTSTPAVDKLPKSDSLASISLELVCVGIVEHALDHDPGPQIASRLGRQGKVAVDGRFEFQMTPAMTFLCVTTLFPWIGGIHNSDDRFEALVVVMMVAIRYAQTGKRFSIHRMKQAVPYSGSEKYVQYVPNLPIRDSCFINGQKAPFSDLMLAGVLKEPDKMDYFLRVISNIVQFPDVPAKVQCKLTRNNEYGCDYSGKYAKMGLDQNGESLDSLVNPYNETRDRKRYRQYYHGKLLTDTWMKHDGHKSICSIFVTNSLLKGADNEPEISQELKQFVVAKGTNDQNKSSGEQNSQPSGKESSKYEHDCNQFDSVIHIEPEREDAHSAWQQMYPFIQIVRTDSEGSIERRKMPLNSIRDFLESSAGTDRSDEAFKKYIATFINPEAAAHTENEDILIHGHRCRFLQ